MLAREAAMYLVAAVKRSEWKRIHRAADAYLEECSSLLRDAFEAGRSALNDQKLHAALTDKSEVRVLTCVSAAITAVQDSLEQSMPDLLLEVMHASATASQKALPKSAAFDPEQPRDEKGQWTSGGGGGKEIEKPNGWNRAYAREELRKKNDGIGSMQDNEQFFEAMRAWHNSTNSSKLEQFAKDHPEDLEKIQRAMRFDAWLDSDSEASFESWEKHGKMKIYRGVVPGGNEEGISWTTSKDTATAFSKEGTASIGWHSGTGKVGHVISQTIKPTEMFGYSDQQGEHEVLMLKIKKNVKGAAAPAEIKGEPFEFDITNPAALAWAKKHAAEFIDGMSQTTREDIRDLVSDAFEEQFDVDELADKVADIIGNDARAETIARTETMRAANEGQLQLWDQATEAGLLTGDEKKEWIVTPDDRLCPICAPLDGEQTGLDDTFNVDGDEIDGPPAHPRCRCTIALAP